MRDQADKLRQIVSAMREHKLTNNMPPRIVTVTSGKGGVGKTNITVNLAIALSELGQRVVVIDADFGLANVDLMLGVTPKYDLSSLIREEKSIDEITCIGPGGINFISGGAGLWELVNLDSRKLENIIFELEKLESKADIILIDTGAGISDRVLKMVMAANETILITTPEPTAITDAYVLAKMSVAMNSNICLKLIINKAESHFEAKLTGDKFVRVAKKFLNTDVRNIGYLLYDANVAKAIKEQLPLVLGYPKSVAAKQIREIAKSFVNRDISSNARGLRGYLQILAGIWNLKRGNMGRGV